MKELQAEYVIVRIRLWQISDPPPKDIHQGKKIHLAAKFLNKTLLDHALDLLIILMQQSCQLRRKEGRYPRFSEESKYLTKRTRFFLCVGCYCCVCCPCTRPRRVGRYGLSVGVYTPSLILCIRLIGA